MPPRELILDHETLENAPVIFNIDDIRAVNPHRFEMELLTAVVYCNPETNTVGGYKDLTSHEFWCRGHMPGMPLMPGVLMCETAAQLCSFFVQKYDLLGAEVVGLGGLEDVRFRDPVRPNSRFYVAAQLTRVRRGAMIVCQFQASVSRTIVCEGVIKGIPLPAGLLRTASK